MKAVTKQEFQWLIKNHYIKQERGRYLDIVVSCGKSHKKTRWVTDQTYDKLRFMKDLKGLK